MYEVFKAAIDSGNFKLENMLERIRTFAVRGMISPAEMNELEDMARAKANVRADTDLFEKVQELEQRIRALEAGTVTPAPESYPEYVPGKWYYNGDRCSENGVNYVCSAPKGVVCTWSPSGYPAYWTNAE